MANLYLQPSSYPLEQLVLNNLPAAAFQRSPNCSVDLSTTAVQSENGVPVCLLSCASSIRGMLINMAGGTHSSMAVLIITYRRPRNLQTLLQVCAKNNISRIYVHVDGPSTPDARQDTEASLAILEEFDRIHPGVLQQQVSMNNLGAAVGVLRACNWVFNNEEFAVILEDDCIPSDSFFHFVIDAKMHILESSNIYAISGFQAAPASIVGKDWSLCSYFSVWGWATTQKKWSEMYQEILSLDIRAVKRARINLSEHAFWKAGARRALEGFVDAWDIPIMLNFRIKNRRAIVPSINLVSNIGFDNVATHTHVADARLNLPTSWYQKSFAEPKENQKLDLWMRKQIYGISIRHIFTTRISLLRDFFVSSTIREPLQRRLRSAATNSYRSE